jgi:hypothetical protein
MTGFFLLSPEMGQTQDTVCIMVCPDFGLMMIYLSTPTIRKELDDDRGWSCQFVTAFHDGGVDGLTLCVTNTGGGEMHSQTLANHAHTN